MDLSNIQDSGFQSCLLPLWILVFDNLKQVIPHFFGKSQSGYIPMLVYVYDMLVVGEETWNMEEPKYFLNSKFHMKDFGDIKYF